MKYIRWFIREISQCKWAYTLVLLCQILMVALALGYVWLSKRLVDVAILYFKGDVAEKSVLAMYAASFLILSMLRPVVVAVKSYYQSKISVSMANRIRLRLFDDLLHLKNEYSRKYHTGDMLNRLQVDVSAVASTFCQVIPNLFWAGIQFLSAFVYLLHIDARLAWILVVIIPVAIVGGRYVMYRVRNLTSDIRKSDSEVESHIQESVQHITLLQILEYTETSSEDLEELQMDNYEKNMRRAKFSVIARTLVAFSFTIGYAVAFLWGVYGIAGGVVTYGALTAILQLVGQVQRPLVQVSDQLPSLMHCTASIDRIEEIEKLPRESKASQHFLGGTSGVSIEHLSFRYSDGVKDIFTDFSFDFAPGSKTSIVGPTGRGKSTLIKLMLSLLTPTEGSVSLYNSKEKVKASEATRCNLVYVPQGNTLFSGTIRENLQMGDPHADDAKMKDALHTAAADFVLELPNGLDTQCFEQGGGLSEGQAQRIAIARALLRPGNILLLDEFSSALDNDTEDLLLRRLTDRMNTRTMIFITHRTRVIDYCDSVLQL